MLLNLKIAAILSTQHHHSYSPGKSPTSGKLSLLVKPSRDHLTVPQGNENFCLDLTSLCCARIVHEYAVSRDFGIMVIFSIRNTFESSCSNLYVSFLININKFRIIAWESGVFFIFQFQESSCSLGVHSAGWHPKPVYSPHTP